MPSPSKASRTGRGERPRPGSTPPLTRLAATRKPQRAAAPGGQEVEPRRRRRKKLRGAEVGGPTGLEQGWAASRSGFARGHHNTCPPRLEGGDLGRARISRVASTEVEVLDPDSRTWKSGWKHRFRRQARRLRRHSADAARSGPRRDLAEQGRASCRRAPCAPPVPGRGGSRTGRAVPGGRLRVRSRVHPANTQGSANWALGGGGVEGGVDDAEPPGSLRPHPGALSHPLKNASPSATTGRPSPAVFSRGSPRARARPRPAGREKVRSGCGRRWRCGSRGRAVERHPPRSQVGRVESVKRSQSKCRPAARQDRGSRRFDGGGRRRPAATCRPSPTLRVEEDGEQGSPSGVPPGSW